MSILLTRRGSDCIGSTLSNAPANALVLFLVPGGSALIGILVAVLVAVCVLLAEIGAAAAQTGRTASVPDQRTTIRMFMPLETKEWQFETKFAIEAFATQHPQFRVQVRQIDLNRFENEIIRRQDAGVGPDLILGPAHILNSLHFKDRLDPIHMEALQSSLDHLTFLDGPMGFFNEGHDHPPYALPYYGSVQALFYRKSWFEDAGLPYPKTIWEALTAAEQFHDPEQGRYGMIIGRLGDDYGEETFAYVALAMGATLVNDRGQPNLNSPQMLQALEIWKRLGDTGPDNAVTRAGRDFYFQDRAAMMMGSTYMMDDLALPEYAARSLTSNNFPQDLTGKAFDANLLTDTGVISILFGNQNASYGNLVGLAFGVDFGPAEARREAARRHLGAFRLARFLFRPDVYISWLHKLPGGLLPVIDGVVQRPEFHRDLQGVIRRYGAGQLIQLMEGMSTVDSFAKAGGLLSPVASQIMDAGIVRRMLTAVYRGEQTPEQAVKRAQQEALIMLRREDAEWSDQE